MKRALISGIMGQDGAYLAELLLSNGCGILGINRQASSFNTDHIAPLCQDLHDRNHRFFPHYCDLTDAANLIRIIQQMQPDEIYNLGAQSDEPVSDETPECTAYTDDLGMLRLLEAIRILGLEIKTRFFQASTSGLYGLVQKTPQREATPFHPRSPYGVAKPHAYSITVSSRA